jgi:glycosyltransferase involved in cell wall biosynthesis
MLANRAQISRESAQQFQLNSSIWSMKRRKAADLLLSCLNPMPAMEILHKDERVAIVVITHNRREEVLRSLARHARLPEQPAIIVVDNASVDGTACAVAEQFPRVHVLRSATNLGAAARTLGVRHAEAPYVALCDDDTWWSPGSLRRAANLFNIHPRLAVATGRVLVNLLCHR